jgi:hypothetical protein
MYGKVNVVIVTVQYYIVLGCFLCLQGVLQIKKIAKELEQTERKHGIGPPGYDGLNFGLMQVVYEWAQGKVSLFHKILIASMVLRLKWFQIGAVYQ